NLDAEQQRELAGVALPLPSSRARIEPDDPRGSVIRRVMDEEGLELRQLQVKGIREMFFSRGERPALCVPVGLSHQTGPDELHPGREKLQLSFELPRGSYATLFVKRISAGI